ncbi:glycosyltransferase family 2 protein [Ammoniphilus sp. CFH 90114]|uniref:glycosyltransferase family 2 protein n=1 Tax=Ammoniphilus sp. CFH 90114 TaxID=2493665 RepID=UPI00100EA4EE|nr:glycosyltransferase family 2 protein [Ammoniphilus sp. CFH 90114]RXT04589.1 glycosyltransferase family 2 protein [Ammoniphilus sp. CFH 90114]
MDLSIIIVNYNTKELTLQAIESVYRSETNFEYELILVDNASTEAGLLDTIIDRFPDVHFIQNIRNVGFSKANNQGISESKGRYILLLNSDTIIEKDTLQVMMDYMEQHPTIGASGCKILLPDGTLDKACKRGYPTPEASFYYMLGFHKRYPNNPRFNQYQLGHLDPDQEHEVDSLVGAFMLLRREVIDQVGPLDEDFFMYGEDIDWCYRIKQAGWKIRYYPKAIILHLKRASSKKKPNKIIYEFYRAMFLFYNKHYRNKYPTWVTGLVFTGIWLKLISSILLNMTKVKPW